MTAAAGATIYPVTAIIEYRNDDGSGAVTTAYAYTFYAGTNAVQQRTTTYPVVSAAQNGSGIAATRLEYLDQLGNLTRETGPRGFIMYQNFDSATASPPRNVGATAGGLNLVTDYSVESLGLTCSE